MTTEMHTVLNNLRAKVESTNGGFGVVYLDNARPDGMSARAFAGHLSQLQQRGLYRPCGDDCFGEVKVGA